MKKPQSPLLIVSCIWCTYVLSVGKRKKVLFYIIITVCHLQFWHMLISTVNFTISIIATWLVYRCICIIFTWKSYISVNSANLIGAINLIILITTAERLYWLIQVTCTLHFVNKNGSRLDQFANLICYNFWVESNLIKGFNAKN